MYKPRSITMSTLRRPQFTRIFTTATTRPQGGEAGSILRVMGITVSNSYYQNPPPAAQTGRTGNKPPQEQNTRFNAMYTLADNLLHRDAAAAATTTTTTTTTTDADAVPSPPPPQLNAARRKDMAQLNRRRWQPGDVYAPHDLSFQEQSKYGRHHRQLPEHDVFDVLGLDPVAQYKNFGLMSEFMADTGKILHHRQTGLRAGNQRRIAKAIRRAIGMGLMPSVHRHPEILERVGPFAEVRRM